MRSVVVLLSVAVALVAGEVLARSRFRSVRYYVWPPYTRALVQLPPGRAPGISGSTRFSINGSGIRGDDYADGQELRILAIGGSTTECLILDDAMAWPHLAQDLANQQLRQARVWIGNVGRAGLRLAHNELQMRHLLAQEPRLNAVILLVGINDLQFRLAADESYRPEAIPASDADVPLMQKAFQDPPAQYRQGDFVQRTELWRLLGTAKRGALARFRRDTHLQDPFGANLVQWRERRRRAASMRDVLPDLSSALENFRRRLETTIADMRRLQARPILITQPAMWRPDLPANLAELLWMGGIGDFQESDGHAYYTAGSLARALDLYNRTLRDVCRDTGADCIDLAAAMPKDSSVFYDDVHFNEAGSRIVAGIVARYVLEHVMPGASPAS